MIVIIVNIVLVIEIHLIGVNTFRKKVRIIIYFTNEIFILELTI